MFECDMCGECCRHVGETELYRDLDRGDGVCRYLDGNRCSIYSERPLLCRIDECYEKYFKNEMSKDEYYKLNYEACEKLKMQRRK